MVKMTINTAKSDETQEALKEIGWHIGKRAVCSKGIKATITGVAKMPWGVSFVGVTDDGTAWSSRNPLVEV